MEIYNKIDLAREMLKEARKIYDESTSQIDHIKVILLSGSVLGIVKPLLQEKDITTTHETKLDLFNHLFESGGHSGIFNMTYNSLKHTGNKNRKVQAWDDLEFEGHITSNSRFLLRDAEKDMKKLAGLLESESVTFE